MLLPIKRPTCANDMHLATQLAGEVLEYAANWEDGPFDESDFCISVKLGAWLLKKKETVGTALIALFKLPQQERALISEAFNHDVNFGKHLDESSFEFSYPKLDKKTQNICTKFLESFYCDILTKSGFKGLPGQALACLDGKSFEESYRKANGKLARLCPACLGPMRDCINNYSQVDREHFFPKSIYSPLSVHPGNLVITCIPCNQRVHVDEDPIDHDKNETLADTFIPYVRSGLDHIELTFERDYPDPIVKLESKDMDQHSIARVRNFERMYKVSEAWKTEIATIHEAIIESIIDRYAPPTLLDVQNELSHEERVYSKKKLDMPGAFLRSHYASWLSSKRVNVFLRQIEQIRKSQCEA